MIFLLPGLQAQELKLVSWNMEHLAAENGAGCVPRSNKDYKALRAYAKTLDADILALQEVESVKAVARVFPKRKWHIILSERPMSPSYTCRGSEQQSTQQRVAMVVRKGTHFENVGSFEELALDHAGLRYGVAIKVFNTSDTIEVMGVHLKSGCFVNNYKESDRKACAVLSEQVPVLDGWIEDHIAQQKKFIILGDFNHRLAEEGNVLWQELAQMNGEDVGLWNSMEHLEGCHPRYPAPIDHILLGPLTAKLRVTDSENVHYYPSSNAEMSEEDMMSDHCPISVQIRLN